MSSVGVPEAPPRTMLPATVVIASIAVLAAAVAGGVSIRAAAGAVVLVTLLVWLRPLYVSWPTLLSALILVILFIPIRRYTVGGNLPIELEPYRIVIAVVIACWLCALAADPKVRWR
ncbi:MAG: hypothetical protein HOQ03_01385, partial [Thermoleophilia bacterium]|nr:hypothetical protein [Thermoleophilia bacterium]